MQCIVLRKQAGYYRGMMRVKRWLIALAVAALLSTALSVRACPHWDVYGRMFNLTFNHDFTVAYFVFIEDGHFHHQTVVMDENTCDWFTSGNTILYEAFEFRFWQQEWPSLAQYPFMPHPPRRRVRGSDFYLYVGLENTLAASAAVLDTRHWELGYFVLINRPTPHEFDILPSFIYLTHDTWEVGHIPILHLHDMITVVPDAAEMPPAPARSTGWRFAAAIIILAAVYTSARCWRKFPIGKNQQREDIL